LNGVSSAAQYPGSQNFPHDICNSSKIFFVVETN
jgi:hypothetical protein